MNSVLMNPIGVIRTPFKEPKGTPIQPKRAGGAAGRVEVYSKFARGLVDLDGFSHIVLLYCFHLSSGYDLTVTPYLDKQLRGLFATRAPRRPNPIGLSIVRLEQINDNILRVRGVDILDGTPLLDIKPYVPEFDSAAEIRIGWLTGIERDSGDHLADERFHKK
jgi:tRNA-Thr(GGU) m(6)t(6)A37 methyltransferase TsaA